MRHSGLKTDGIFIFRGFSCALGFGLSEVVVRITKSLIGIWSPAFDFPRVIVL